MRKIFLITFAMSLVTWSMPVGSAATVSPIEIETSRAVVSPDGTTAGEISDFVLAFVDPDPSVPGISLMEGATVTAILPAEFVNTGSGATAVALLQGWPQSPPAPPPLFPWTVEVSGNSIVTTLTADYLVGAAGPGPKAVHYVLNSFRNPARPGTYDVDLIIRPDPNSADTYEGVGSVRIIPKARRSINVVSVFSGGGPPPPFNNPLFQSVTAGDDSLDVGLYLWDKRSSVADDDIRPMLGVDVKMTNPGHGRLVQGKKTVGHVWIDAPPGASGYELTSTGPSFVGTAVVTGLDVGILVVTLETAPDAVGTYHLEFKMNGGNRQEVFVTAEAGQ